MLARGAHLVRQMTLFSRGTFVTRDRRAAGAIRRARPEGVERREYRRGHENAATQPVRMLLWDHVGPQINGLS